MHCCTANGARTLYYVWDSIVQKDGDLVRVNLLLNRASQWLDVDSYLPVDGKVVLTIKDAPLVAVRMPEWCDPSSVFVAVGDDARRSPAEGRCVRIDRLNPGDTVTLTFPVPERTLHRMIGEIPYTLELRGSNVVDIAPKGIAYPLFEDQMTPGTTRKTRFVPGVDGVKW
jgi:DUF1680 family protein